MSFEETRRVGEADAGRPTIVLVTSSRDTASMTIARGLKRNHPFESTKIMFMGNPVFQNGHLLLVQVDTELIEPPDLDQYFNPRAYVFLSRHRADSGIPSLTAHTTGNFTHAPFLGGNPMEVGRVDPDLQKNYMLALGERRDQLDGYETTVEATHHGPTSLQKPVLFVELGSSEKNWEDEHAGAVVGDAIIEALETSKSWDKVAIVFGGTHYPEKVNKLLLETDFAVASVVAKHSLEAVDEMMFAQIIQKSTKFPRYAGIDWKGMGRHKEKIVGFAKQFSLEILRL